jgi:hypothetical protein
MGEGVRRQATRVPVLAHRRSSRGSGGEAAIESNGELLIRTVAASGECRNPPGWRAAKMASHGGHNAAQRHPSLSTLAPWWHQVTGSCSWPGGFACACRRADVRAIRSGNA